MERRIRNRLAEIFIRGFDRPEAGVAIEILAFLLRPERSGSGESLARLIEELGRPEEQVRRALELLGEAPALIRQLGATSGGAGAAPTGLPPEIAVDPGLRGDSDDIRERLERYLRTLLEARAAGGTPTEAAYERARGAFNRGLFFEAHEILEQVWRPLPPGPLRLYLQGIIQVSVGLHHAGQGRFRGAMNQLGKGLEKLTRVLREHPDAPAAAFCAAAARLRDMLADPRTSSTAAGTAGSVRLDGGLPPAIRDAPPRDPLDRPGPPC